MNAIYYGAGGKNEEVKASKFFKHIELTSVATALYGMADGRFRNRPEIQDAMLGISKKKIKEMVRESKRQKEKVREKGKSGKRTPQMEVYCIHKALTMELLAGHFMAQTDSPLESRANCVVKGGGPCHYAPRGQPDVTVTYATEYKVNVEVSAKEDMDEKSFNSQLESAVRHMKAKEAQVTLLVTEWGYNESRRLLEGFMKSHWNDFREGQEIIVISTLELVDIAVGLSRLFLNARDQEQPFPAGKMPSLLSALASNNHNLLETWLEQVKNWINNATTQQVVNGEEGPEQRM